MDQDVLKKLLDLGAETGRKHLTERMTEKGVPSPLVNLAVGVIDDVAHRVVEAILEAIETKHVVMKSSGESEVEVVWEKPAEPAAEAPVAVEAETAAARKAKKAAS